MVPSALVSESLGSSLTAIMSTLGLAKRAPSLLSATEKQFRNDGIDNGIGEVLLEHVQNVSPNFNWETSASDLECIIMRMKESAPGPDGIPDSAYKACVRLSTDRLFAVYRANAQGSRLPDTFNHADMVFILKGQTEHGETP